MCNVEMENSIKILIIVLQCIIDFPEVSIKIELRERIFKSGNEKNLNVKDTLNKWC